MIGEFARVPLAEIRARLEAVSSSEERERMAAILRSDSRSGARLLGDAIDRRERARHTERERLVRFFARREQLLQSGVNFVAGVDEVGVGPLAGPLVAAAVVFPHEVELEALSGLDDSKRVARKAREALDREIRKQAAAVFVAEISSIDVDRLNPHGASLAAMKRAVAGLPLQPGHVLVDARTIPDLAVPQTALIHGDALDASIAAASIVAKVHRDAWMCELDERYPGYGFSRHMGYGTREHLAALDRLGPCPAHRQSFAPVSRAQVR
ncbi:MAG: ribonuclease HII [Deltaproteobacteria bacterium]|nr:ribonuclease HII [Deltaproteobacteria bacterium]MBW2577251.1 ribonuclease HII [Deltaproteobacteria bacterium]MBW2692371.1 ribonuclease HII [Deltaproteobacteria bacterium]